MTSPLPEAPDTAGSHTNLLHLPRWVLALLLAVCVAVCTWVLYTYGPAEWSHLRRIAGGGVLGVWCFLCLFINRVLIST